MEIGQTQTTDGSLRRDQMIMNLFSDGANSICKTKHTLHFADKIFNKYIPMESMG